MKQLHKLREFNYFTQQIDWLPELQFLRVPLGRRWWSEGLRQERMWHGEGGCRWGRQPDPVGRHPSRAHGLGGTRGEKVADKVKIKETTRKKTRKKKLFKLFYLIFLLKQNILQAFTQL